ncbi:hypothetical protein V6N13_124320 [Hibiscus sabdariffa]
MANTSARYTLVSAKNKWEEQGFHFDDSLPNYGLEQFVYNRLHELGWFRFAQQPARANYNWALEFYANNSAGEDNVIVRGRRVAANAATINSILGLPNDAPSFYAMLGALEDEDYETIKDYLCLEGTAWNTTGRNPHSVSRTQLLPEAKLRNTFVKRNLLPTSHNQTVDRTRLVLIHTIITGYRINVGEILAKPRSWLLHAPMTKESWPSPASSLPYADEQLFQPARAINTRQKRKAGHEQYICAK